MFKILSISACLLLFTFTSCESTPKEMAEQVEETTDEAQTAIGNGMEAMEEAMEEGENYVIKVLDDKIKSPRKELSGEVGGVPVTINYGSPAVNDRVIYGDLVPYEKVWRTGANEATRITFTEDVMVGTDGKKLEAGTYSLFTLPQSKEEWTIIFNKTADQWGAYDYEESADAARVSGTSATAGKKAERMNFAVDGDSVKMMWDDLVVAFPVGKVSK